MSNKQWWNDKSKNLVDPSPATSTTVQGTPRRGRDLKRPRVQQTPREKKSESGPGLPPLVGLPMPGLWVGWLVVLFGRPVGQKWRGPGQEMNE